MTTFTDVYLARHGQTLWNVERRRQGHLDSPLTEQGLSQAEHTAAIAKTLDTDGVFTSPLGRARTTAEVVATHIGETAITVEQLSEVHHGRMGGLTKVEIERDFPNSLEDRAKDKYHYRFPDGESYADADERARTALDFIAGRGVHRPLIVSHEMIGRMLLRNLLNQDPVDALGWNHPHDVVYHVNIAARTVDRIRLDRIERAWPTPC